MRMVNHRANAAGAVNAQVREVVDYAPDPNGVALAASLQNEIAQRLQGHSGFAYIGDKGDPSRTWAGPLPSAGQFVGMSMLARNPRVIRDQMTGADISTGTVDEGPFADVTQRIFAARLARRSAL